MLDDMEEITCVVDDIILIGTILEKSITGEESGSKSLLEESKVVIELVLEDKSFVQSTSKTLCEEHLYVMTRNG